jgi:uncharacterized protein
MKSHQQHSGELYVQEKRNAPEEISYVLREITDSKVPYQNLSFFTDLKYFPISTLDADGFPWVTLLSDPEIKFESQIKIKLSANYSTGDPFVECLKKKIVTRYFAGLGIDFTNRRRNKLSGIIQNSSINGNRVELEVLINEYLGNCPKYITVRKLVKKERNPESPIEMKTLNDFSKNIINIASTIFLGTKHISKEKDENDVGLNHRGGPPGFVRYYEENSNAFLIIPDYSGNRFFQSLGNIQSDKVAGVLIPDFVNGDLLYCTGLAENLFDEEASNLIPNITLLTRIKIMKFVLIKQGLSLEIIGPEVLSPYNPQLKKLKSEMKDLNILEDKSTIKLVNVEKLTSNISTFTFKSSFPLTNLKIGGYAILDFSSFFNTKYQHMDQNNPQSLNDDLVRTWTISSRSKDEFSLTIKKIGKVTNFLHNLKEIILVPLLGFGGDFSCFEGDQVPKKMIWFAGGVGITPFMAMYQELKNKSIQSDILLYFSCRGEESSIANEMKSLINVKIFDSSLKKESKDKFKRRISIKDIESIEDLPDRVAFVCGPESFMTTVVESLSKKIDPDNIKLEKYTF